MNLGCFLEGRVHRAEHLGRQDERERSEAETLNETHADGCRDIDGPAFETEEIDEPAVQNTDSWMGDQRPAHGSVDSRYQQTQGHEGVNQRLSGKRRPLYQPGDRQADNERNQSARCGKDEGVLDDLEQEWIRQELAVVC